MPQNRGVQTEKKKKKYSIYSVFLMGLKSNTINTINTINATHMRRYVTAQCYNGNQGTTGVIL